MDDSSKRAYRVYVGMEAGFTFFTVLAFTVTSIYLIQTVGLDPLQLVLVGTVLEATCFVFEVPTGVVADTFSRRLSIIIGTSLIGAGIALEGLVPVFAAILIAQVVSGIGYTFSSGAVEAWAADEIGDEHLSNAFMRGSQASNAAAVAGIIVSVGLASIHLQLPIVLGGALIIVMAAALALTMPERGFKPTPREDRTTWQAMGHTFREGLRVTRRSPRLGTFLLIALFLGMTSEGFDRLWEANFLTNFVFPDLAGLSPVVWFGVINVVGALISIGATELVRRRVNVQEPGAVVRSIVVFTGLRVASVVLFALAPVFWLALVGRWGKSAFMSAAQPVYRAWLAQSIEPQVRATVLSMTAQMDAVGQIAGGPAIGAVGKGVSVRAAIALSGLLLLPVLPLYARAHRQHKEEPEQAVLAAEPATGD